MSDPKNPNPGDPMIDISDLKVIDLTEEQLSKMIRVRDGIVEAVQSILSLTPELRKRAGISEDAFEQLVAAKANYEYAISLLPAVQKLAELVSDTAIYEGNELSVLLGECAQQARRRSSKKPERANEFMAPLKPLLNYHFGPAQEAAKTRARNSEPDPEGDSSTPSSVSAK